MFLYLSLTWLTYAFHLINHHFSCGFKQFISSQHSLPCSINFISAFLFLFFLFPINTYSGIYSILLSSEYTQFISSLTLDSFCPVYILLPHFLHFLHLLTFVSWQPLINPWTFVHLLCSLTSVSFFPAIH